MANILHTPSKGYLVFHRWVRHVFERYYYRKIYRLHTEHVPKAGTPTVFVSNHQNSLLDALQMIYAANNPFLHFICRADVFQNKLLAKILYGLGLIPIYRIRDGVGKIKNNLQMFEEVEQYLHEGGMLSIYPEATHMDGNWLGRFYHSFVRLGFEAAQLSNFEQEVFILPAGLYFEDFKKIRSQSMIDFCPAFSLKPFYESYKANPRQTEEEVSAIIRHQVQEKVLDVKDREHYTQVMDFISYTETNYARQQKDVDMQELPQALKVRQAIEAKLSARMESNAQQLEQIYEHTENYSKKLRKFGIDDKSFLNPFTSLEILSSAALYLVMLPVYLLGMLPHIALYWIAPLATKKIRDKLMQASIDICVWAFGIPIFYLIYFILIGCTNSWLFSLIFILLLPALGKFAYWYHNNFQTDWKRLRAFLVKTKRPKSWQKLNQLRETLDKDFDSLQ